MKTRLPSWLYAFLAISGATCIGFQLWFFNGSPPKQLDDFGFLIGTSGMIGVFLWAAYRFTLSLKVLPKVDELVYPDRVDFFKIADNQLFKMLRLNEYAAAIHSKRARRLNPLKVDLRTLPGQLRVPITVYLYWMILNFGAMITGFLIFSYTGRL